MKRNLTALLAEGNGPIVAACASCGSALRHLYPMVLRTAGESEWLEKAETVAARVRDVSEFLVAAGPRPPEQELPRRVTFHDPCHLARGQGVKAQPRQLLRTIPGLEFVELNESDRCCGGAGTFSFTHYELALKINDRKVDNIARSGAEIVATECPGCKLQLNDGLRRRGVRARARQAVELLAEAYGPAAALP